MKVQTEPTSDNPSGAEDEDEDGLNSERDIARSLLRVLYDGSPLVRAELAIGDLPAPILDCSPSFDLMQCPSMCD